MIKLLQRNQTHGWILIVITTMMNSWRGFSILWETKILLEIILPLCSTGNQPTTSTAPYWKSTYLHIAQLENNLLTCSPTETFFWSSFWFYFSFKIFSFSIKLVVHDIVAEKSGKIGRAQKFSTLIILAWLFDPSS